MITEYCKLLNQNNLSLPEIQEWLIDVNLAITYLLTNFYIKKNSQKYCNFYAGSPHPLFSIIINSGAMKELKMVQTVTNTHFKDN